MTTVQSDTWALGEPLDPAGGQLSNQRTASSSRGVAAVEQLDPQQIEICQRHDGMDWILGAGTYGVVSMSAAADCSTGAKTV